MEITSITSSPILTKRHSTDSQSKPTSSLTPENLTSSIPPSPLKFKDSVSQYNTEIEPISEIANDQKKSENFSNYLNNMLLNITGNSSVIQEDLEKLDNDESTQISNTKNRSISSASSFSAAGKTIKDLFLKDADEFSNENREENAIAKTNELLNRKKLVSYSSFNNIRYAEPELNEKFHTTFKNVPEDESLLSEVFNVTLAKEKPKQKSNHFTTSALSIGSALTANAGYNGAPDELTGIDDKISLGHDKDNNMFWFEETSSSQDKAGTNNGELFISEKYIAFQSYKNILNLWSKNILIYIHDIESINNGGTILINKHRANKDLSKMKATIINNSKGNENGITITTVYEKTYAFYNIPELRLVKRTIQTIWDIQVEGMSYLSDKEITPPLEHLMAFKSLDTKPSSNGELSRVHSSSSMNTESRYFKNSSLIARPGLSPNMSISKLNKLSMSNDNLMNKLSKTSSNISQTEETDIEDEIMSIDDIESSSSNNNIDDMDEIDLSDGDTGGNSSSQDQKSITTMVANQKTLDDESAIVDKDYDDDSFDSDEEYYNSALRLSPEEYNKIITVYDFKENSKFNYTGPLYHEDTEFLESPEIDQNEEIMAELTVDCAPGQLFEIMYSEQFNDFLIEFLENQSSSKFVPLNFGKFDKMNQDSQRYREYQYEKKLNYPIGPSATTCFAKETLITSNPEEFYKIINTTTTPSVPSGNAFNVKTCYQIRWNDNGKSFLKISFWIEWVKSSWIKGMIEKSVTSGQKDATKVFCDILLKYCEENIGEKQMPKGKAMRSLVFNHRLSVTSKKRILSGNVSKSRQGSFIDEKNDESAQLRSPLFKPQSPRKSPQPLKRNKLDDVSEFSLDGSNPFITALKLETEVMNDKIGRLEKQIFYQNIIVTAVMTIFLILLLNYKITFKSSSDNLTQHLKNLINSGYENRDVAKELTDVEITEQLLTAIDKLIIKRINK
ncbi:hypothetical protein FOG50_03513 [Hanseniaspora uvarum]|nr:hypothetical protein FOG50_03513 [Hanseniaspora uvarum]